ncbi:MAG: mercuric reductase [Litorilinea sp.]
MLIRPWDTFNQRLVANVHPPTWQNPTPSGKYNLVVIGGGSAGLVAAAGAAGLGAKVALVEKHLLGGDCLNVGCVPSKSVIRAARAAGDVACAGEFGVHVSGAVSIDFGAVMARMRRVRADISDHDSAQRFANLGIDVFLGEGHFGSGDTFMVGDATLHFSKALIATGSRAAIPPIPGLDTAGYLTNETLFELTERPERLAIIGGGPIGAEMAQAFQRLGSQVYLLDAGARLLHRDDADAAALVADALARDGVQLLLKCEISGATLAAGKRTLSYTIDGQAAELTVDAVLVAAGRQPNIETLDLAAAGVTAHRRGIEVNDYLQSSNPNIYAAGDVGFKYQFTHTADFTARIVLQNALFPFPKRKASDLIVPWTTYTDPEVAHVGLTPADAEQAGIAITTFSQAIGETDRGRADGDDEGFVRVHVKRGSDKILGATIVARHAGEMLNEITLAMNNNLGLKSLANVIHPYPTQAEAIRQVADQYNRTRLTAPLQRVAGWWMARTR